MTAKEFLSQYRTLNAEINAKLDEAAQIRALAERVTPSEQCGGSGTVSDRIGHGAARLVDLEREINQDIDRLVDLQAEIVTMIREVGDYNQRMVLRLRYINGWTWEKIAESLGFSYQWVCVLHGRGLENFIKNFSRVDRN
ncbi:MAG: DUF1492 domain-containing protein [Ruminiclostridium sp.]|nr:DUF1492 domain-containing protein [Ruminiclostridium sp.]